MISIIPARGGSKRISHKNIIDFFGKPLIAWTIEAAIESKLFEVVLVSTEDEEIAQISRDYGADVPFLREKHFDDHSTVSMVTSHALEQAKLFYRKEFGVVCQLMANCPIRDASDIKAAYQNFVEEKNNFQISSFSFGWMNPWWAYQINDQELPVPLFKEALLKRSQDLPDLQCPTGAVWIAKVDEFEKCHNFYGPSFRFCEMSWTSAVDIDDYRDIEMAKSIYLMKSQEFR
jgi:N-acylneuraminate cytidylyltransferase